MSGSCSKQDKKKNSIQGKAYLAGKRWDVNAKKRAIREQKRVARDAARVASMKVKRGTARRLRRQQGEHHARSE